MPKPKEISPVLVVVHTGVGAINNHGPWKSGQYILRSRFTESEQTQLERLLSTGAVREATEDEVYDLEQSGALCEIPRSPWAENPNPNSAYQQFLYDQARVQADIQLRIKEEQDRIAAINSKK